jgi:hypothetical protein
LRSEKTSARLRVRGPLGPLGGFKAVTKKTEQATRFLNFEMIKLAPKKSDACGGLQSALRIAQMRRHTRYLFLHLLFFSFSLSLSLPLLTFLCL